MTQNLAGTRRTIPTVLAFAAAIASMTTFFIAAGAPTPLLIIEQERWGFPSSLLTLAFGIYAIGLLGTLITAGRLSDFVGRRPVLASALIVETAAFVLLLTAANIQTVILARLVQGIATGAATSAFSSAVLELAPQKARGIAASIVSAAPAGGLGLGALTAGALTSISTSANTVVWAVLAAMTILGALAVLASPETIAARPGALASLRPSIALPEPIRPSFRTAVPTLVAAWMMAALFMGLVPTTLRIAFRIDSTFVDGATSFLEPGAAAITTLFAARFAPRTLLRVAGTATAVGAILFLVGLTTHELWLLDVAGVVGGVGFGTAVAGTIRSTIPNTPADRRAGVFSAIYALSYLAFGLPAIVAGILIGLLSLTPVVSALVLVIALLGSAGLLAELSSTRRSTPAACAA